MAQDEDDSAHVTIAIDRARINELAQTATEALVGNTKIEGVLGLLVAGFHLAKSANISIETCIGFLESLGEDIPVVEAVAPLRACN